MNDQRICELAARYGIWDRYHDIWGNEHVTSNAKKEALFVAMRHDEQTEPGDGKSDGTPYLPAALVVTEGQAIRFEIKAPDQWESVTYRWRCTDLNTAEYRSGTFDHADVLQQKQTSSWLFHLDEALAPGYYRLELLPRQAKSTYPLQALQTIIIVCPKRCYFPANIDASHRAWGLSVQLYSLRSQHNWGIGDLGDLYDLLGIVSRLGGDMVGINPLHALFVQNPRHASPYSPSTRLFINPLYIAVDRIIDFSACEVAQTLVNSPDFQRSKLAATESELVDYQTVASLKYPVLEALFEYFDRQHLDTNSQRAQRFLRFVEQGGEDLRLYALFEAIDESIASTGEQQSGFKRWPTEFQDRNHPCVIQFEREHAKRVRYFQYLQWIADSQLSEAMNHAKMLGLRIGIYTDLALGACRDGAECWASPEAFARGASLGAPPDDFAPQGQDWGLPPLIPSRLQQAAYQPFIAALRANMRGSGAIRIDHVMGLMRAFWVLDGQGATDGTYVSYPLDDLMGIVALESHRNRCIVIGEDLGTVPPQVHQAMAERDVLSYRVFIFCRDHQGSFLPPSAYPPKALVTASTHDLPTLCGFWESRDIQLRHEFGTFTADQANHHFGSRQLDRQRLLWALRHEGLISHDADDNALLRETLLPEGLRSAIQCFLARTPTMVMAVQLEDVLGMRDQANLPATVDEHPNWQRKISVQLQQLETHPMMKAIAQQLRGERGHTAAR